MTDPFPAPPIVRRPGSFADFTITRRFPKIAATARESLAGVPGAARAVDALVADVIAGARLGRTPLARPTPFWTRYLAARAEATWTDLPFFDLEFVFYLALNTIAGFFEGGARHGVDVFATIRAAARQAALVALSPATVAPSGHQLPDRAELDERVWRALLGNEADLSQLVAAEAHASPWTERLVADQRPALMERLVAAPHGEIHLLADNAGPELLADLLLADTLLRLGDRRVVFQCKPCPMFVSDALPDDVSATVGGLGAHGAAAVRAAGARLDRAMVEGRLRAESHPDWGEPRHGDALEPPLTAALKAADLVLAKGDLNYRRFTGDRDWPIATPPEVASRAVPFAAFALRVLKSDTLVGVAPAAAERAARLSASWRTDGTHALVQRLGAQP